MSGTQMTMSNEVSRISSTHTSQLSDKYHGMIKISSYKKIRNLMFILFGYIYSMAPNYYLLHSFMSIYRVMQFLSPILCAPFTLLWENSSSKIAKQLASFLTIFSHLLPVDLRDNAYIPILYTFIGIEFFFLVFVLYLAFYFRKKSQLPFIAPYLIVIFIGSFGYFLPPLYAEYMGEMVGHMISGTNTFSYTIAIPGFVISIILYFLYGWLFVKVITVAATFRPNSLLSATKTPQTVIFINTVIVNFLSGVASKSPKIICIFFMVLTGFVYFTTIVAIYMDGGFMSPIHCVLIAAASISGGVFMLVSSILVVMNTSSSEIVLISILVFFIITFFITKATNNSSIYRHLSILDSVYESEENFDLIRSPTHFMNVLCTGMSLAHPACTNWSFCRLAAAKWPNDIRIWYFFAKFIAIYPEETQQLLIISQNITQHKLKGSYAKQTLEQIYTVIRLREANLSAHLKDKLNEITKLTQTTKHKMRHVWDMIIQGNLSELENAIHSTYNAIEKSSAEFHHVLSQYPNNRFVSRNYSRFLLDVLADIKGFEKYDNDTKMLQRGLNATEDQAHRVGLHAFPLLPTILRDKANGQLFMGTTAEDMSTIETLIETDSVSVEQTQAIIKQMDEIRLPSFVLLRTVRPISYFVCCVVPIVAMLIYSHMVIDDEAQPLEFLSILSSIRNSVFLLPTFSEEFVFEKISCITNKIPVTSNPYYLGSANDIEGQLTHLGKEAQDMISRLRDLRDFRLGDKHIDQIRVILFTTKYSYLTFPSETDPNYTIPKPTTGYGCVLDFVLMVADLLAKDNITSHTLDLQNIQNQLQNMELISGIFTESMEILITYMSTREKIASAQMDLILVIICVVVALFIILTNYSILKKVSSDKLVIYRCLTALPKNVVSNIADRLKILKKNQMGGGGDSSFVASTDGDMNRQEENMLKIFATAGGDSHTRTRTMVLNSALASVDFVALVGSVILIGMMTKDICYELNRAAPHVDYLLGTFSYAMGILDNVYRIGSILSNCRVPNIDVPKMQLFNNKLMETSTSYFNTVRYGNEKIESFKQFNYIVNEISQKLKCDDSISTLTGVYSCMKPQLQYHYFEVLMNTLVLPAYRFQQLYLLDDVKVTNLWNLLTIHLYNDFFAPFSERIAADVKTSIQDEIFPVIIACSALAFFIVVVEIIVLSINIDGEKKLKFTIRLLLHCPPNAILQSGRIASLLAGDFNDHSHEKTLRNSEYFQEILRNLPDSIIVLDETHTISEINKSGKRLFDVEFHDIMNVTELFDFSENKALAKFFSPEIPTASPNNKQEDDSPIFFKRSDGTNFHLQVGVCKMKLGTVITIRDITQTVRYNKLISEERAKSDVLLASILPPKLVPRVRSGEKDISFAVQTATIVFIDIVEFTPWCASLQADEVMLTLNKMFTLFDSSVAKYPTMTRIKCIGDCYMAAGGIFSEVNQPDVHAKEVVEFGIDTIDKIEHLNKESGHHLRIRVGINTGGPIVAGVLGVEKPTFEIIGPAINMAQQMEHHGVPMQVHISRSVYELIYGGAFDIKERGEIDIKNGSVLTYLVSRK